MKYGRADNIKTIKDVKLESVISEEKSPSMSPTSIDQRIGFGESNLESPSPIFTKSEWRNDTSPKESYFK